jgi:hypothetical protein
MIPGNKGRIPMKNKIALLFISLTVVTAVIAGLVLPTIALAAAPTTQVHIVKYAADGTTIIGETTKTYQWLESNLPVQGDGITHYYTQGPTFIPDNIWDPAETVNLKDKGALKGTDLKDLCNLVGGMGPLDTVTVRASDGYGNDIFPYANVYTPDPKQGKMVISWYSKDYYDDAGVVQPGGYVPTFSNGMLLAFFAQTANAAGQYVFGHQDMQDCFPPTNYHWYYDGGIQYPSTNGAYYKWVSEIKIYTDGATNWTTQLSGARQDILTRTHFENCQACHGPPAEYTDAEGNTWSGLPLWYVLGAVDDTTNIHGAGAFNDNLYYDVKVTGGGGYNYTFGSTDVAKNNSIILADKVKLAGTEEFVVLPEDKYPLKVVSSTFTNGGPSVAGVTQIELKNISTSAPTYPPVTPVPAEWPLKLYGAQMNTMTQSGFEGCVSCHPASYTDTSGDWTGISLWRLMGVVDDTNTHGAGDFNDALASAGYDVVAIGADTYAYTFGSALLANNDNIIVANKLNGQPLPVNDGETPSHPLYPLKLVGNLEGTGWKIGSLVRIDLRNFPSTQPIWDLNNDHICDIGDVVKLGLVWNQTGAGGWIPEDLNSDGVIDIGDVVMLGLHWNATW